MWTKYLIIGTLSSILLLLSGCGRDHTIMDPSIFINYDYVNELNVPVKMEFFRSASAGRQETTYKSLTMVVEAGETYRYTIETIFSGDTPPTHHHSLQIIFNGTKELWYYEAEAETQDDNPLSRRNYTFKEEAVNESTLTFNITQDMYDLATDIE